MTASLNIIACISFIFVMNGCLYGQKYDLNAFPPYDPAVKTGELPNGMKYYIRSNKLPENLGNFYLVINAGAIQEEDDQDGLAHFTEHMAFNGTKNFPGKSIINYLATIGVKFGRNLNAGTGVEQTTYRITSVPLRRESTLDSVLLILHDWAHYLSFDSLEIEAERGVIREEWRMYGSAGERMNRKLLPVIYKDSKYARRNVIGDTAVINNFRHQTIKNFYRNWYRPDLQALVIVGDFDAAAMESKVVKLFSNIPRAENPVPREKFSIPDNTDPLIGIATDPENTDTDVTVYYKNDAVPDSAKNLGYMRLRLIQRMINIMFVQRMADLTRRENPPFITAYSRYGSFTRAKDAFFAYATARNNEALRAMEALLTEMDRLKKHGFTSGEIERTKSDVIRSYQSQFAEKDKRKSNELISLNISHFTVNNPNPGIDYEYEFARYMLPGITLEEVNNIVKTYVHQENMVVIVTAPEKEGITTPAEEEIKQVIATIKSKDIEPYADNLSGKKLIEKEPVPGKVVKRRMNKEIGTVEWTLSNGARVVFKPTSFKTDEVLMNAWSIGGYTAADDASLPSAQVTDNVAVESGVGSFSRTELGKMLAGKRINLTPSIGPDRESIFGYFSPQDFETAMQLVYLYFTSPRWNETEYKTWLDKMQNSFINMKAEPRKAFSDSVNVLLNNRNKRYRPTTYEFFDEVSFEKIKAFYHDRFCDASDFIFTFTGNIDPKTVKPFVEKYLASLPVVKRKDVYVDEGIRPPKNKVVNDFEQENKTPRTSVFIYFHGSSSYTPEQMIVLSALRHILELRYIEAIREEKGGTYSIRVSAFLKRLPEPTYNVSMSFDTDPKMADELKAIVYKELEKLAEKGPEEADLMKTKEYFLKQFKEDMKENNWWQNTVLEEYYFDNINILNGYEASVQKLTAKTIRDYATGLLSHQNVIEVIMRPK